MSESIRGRLISSASGGLIIGFILGLRDNVVISSLGGALLLMGLEGFRILWERKFPRKAPRKGMVWLERIPGEAVAGLGCVACLALVGLGVEGASALLDTVHSANRHVTATRLFSDNWAGWGRFFGAYLALRLVCNLPFALVSACRDHRQAREKASALADYKEEPGLYDIILLDYGESVSLVKYGLMELLGLGSDEAGALVEGLPRTIRQVTSRQEAGYICEKLQTIGATVKIAERMSPNPQG